MRLNIIDLRFQRELPPTTLFSMRLYADALDIEATALEYDATTGLMAFNFAYTDDGDNNTTENPLTLTGRFESGAAVFTVVQ